MDDNENAVDLWQLDEDSLKLREYFEELEEKLREQSGEPIHLLEAELAKRVSSGINQLTSAEEERFRAWKHVEPSEAVLDFLRHVAELMATHRIADWTALARELQLPPTVFNGLARFGKDAEELRRYLAEVREQRRESD